MAVCVPFAQWSYFSNTAKEGCRQASESIFEIISMLDIPLPIIVKLLGYHHRPASRPTGDHDKKKQEKGDSSTIIKPGGAG